MKLIAEIIFWLSIGALGHTYLFYPLLLQMLASRNRKSRPRYQSDEELPQVSVIMSLYNEEQVIGEKIHSIFSSDYPTAKLNVFIGSDCSSDGTNEIVDRFSKDIPNLHFYPFTQRRGKPGVINELSREALKKHSLGVDHVLLITDANVMLTPTTLRNLTRNFKDEKVVIVDANMVHTGMQSSGISKAENQYISTEVKLKFNEGLVWGKMVGPFGGCYAIRSTHFTEVPATFLVDDFYIAMRAFEKGGDALNDLEAICYEGVSHEIREEYRRKSRISAGNFQNLLTFTHLWWPPFNTLCFAFFSHKVLRWLGPFFLILVWSLAGLLGLLGYWLYQYAFVLLSFGVLVLPFLDWLLQKLKINWLLFRGVRYFVLMNLALLEGFFKFIRGVKSNIWEPPKRN